MTVSRATVLAVLAVVALVPGCADSERWSKQDWAQTLGRAEARLPPPPADMKTVLCLTEQVPGKCFLDPDERRIRDVLWMGALFLKWRWTQELCEQIAARTKRAKWPSLAEKCAQVRWDYLNGLRGSGVLDDAALVEASDRDGVADYVRFVAVLMTRLGPVPESDWHKELRIAASRREGSAPRFTYPLPPPGCSVGDDRPRTLGCMLRPNMRHDYRTEILRTLLQTWMAGLWSACEARAATTPRRDLPALASTCLDLRDLFTKSAISGIRLNDFGLIDCKNLSLETRDWPRLIDEIVGGGAKDSPDRPSPCEDRSIEGSP